MKPQTFPIVDMSHEMTPHEYYYSLLDRSGRAKEVLLRLRYQEHLWNYPNGGNSPEYMARKRAKNQAAYERKQNLKAKYGLASAPLPPGSPGTGPPAGVGFREHAQAATTES